MKALVLQRVIQVDPVLRRLRLQSALVHGVEHLISLEELWARVVAGPPLAHPVRESSQALTHGLARRGGVRRCAHKHEVLEPRKTFRYTNPMRDSVPEDGLHRHHAAPAVADDVKAVLYAEVLEHVEELGDHEIDRPERWRLLLCVRRASEVLNSEHYNDEVLRRNDPLPI
jgi:hypothetical protein